LKISLFRRIGTSCNLDINNSYAVAIVSLIDDRQFQLEAIMKMAVEKMAWVCDILKILLGLRSWWLLTMLI